MERFFFFSRFWLFLVQNLSIHQPKIEIEEAWEDLVGYSNSAEDSEDEGFFLGAPQQAVPTQKSAFDTFLEKSHGGGGGAPVVQATTAADAMEIDGVVATQGTLSPTQSENVSDPLLYQRSRGSILALLVSLCSPPSILSVLS